MNAALLEAEDAMLLQASWVEPGSVKDHPPTEIQVSKPVYWALTAVKSLSMEAIFASMLVIVKVSGTKYAKAILR